MSSIPSHGWVIFNRYAHITGSASGFAYTAKVKAASDSEMKVAAFKELQVEGARPGRQYGHGFNEWIYGHGT